MPRLMILFLMVAVLVALADVPVGERFSMNAYAYQGMPGTTATITSTTVYVDGVVVINNSSSAITFRLRDRSTDCAGAACPLVPDDISVAAKSMYTIPYPKIEAKSGITWACSDGSNVILRIVGQR
jgi:hypothetical protein